MEKPFTERERRIIAAVKATGRFTLPAEPREFSQVEADLTACETLIERGLMEWLGSGVPGVREVTG